MVTEIHIAAGGTMRVAPVGTDADGPWIEAGYTSEGITVNAAFEGEPEFDIEALRRFPGREISFTFTLDKRSRRALRFMFGRRVHARNRCRNPLHAVRDHLRRHARERSRGR